MRLGGFRALKKTSQRRPTLKYQSELSRSHYFSRGTTLYVPSFMAEPATHTSRVPPRPTLQLSTPSTWAEASPLHRAAMRIA